MKKKIIAMIVGLVCILGLTACVDESEVSTAAETETIQETADQNVEEEAEAIVDEEEIVEEEVKEEPEFYDEIFLENMSKALEARWELAYGGIQNNEVSGAEEYQSFVDAELEYLEDCREKKFEDSKLQQYAITYMNAIYSQSEAIQYYDSENEEDIQKWIELWSNGVKDRQEVIVALYDDYDLKISPERVNGVNGMRNNIYINKYGQESFYNAIYDQWDETVVSTETDDGYYVVSMTLTNITNYDFKDMTAIAMWFDADGNKIDETSDFVEEWDAGTSIEVSFQRSNKEIVEGGMDIRFE